MLLYINNSILNYNENCNYLVNDYVCLVRNR